MRLRVVATVAFLIIAIFAVAFLIVEAGSGEYNKSFIRNTQSQEEENALSAAENIDYASIFGAERFDGSSDPEAYLHPGAFLEYTSAHFIDSQVLNYYETRFNSLQGQGKPKVIDFSYKASVHSWSQIRFSNGPKLGNGSYYNNTLTISSLNGTVLFTKAVSLGSNWGMKFAFRNGTSYQMLEAGGINLEFADCYVMEMSLEYGETYASTAAFNARVYQIIILDWSFTPVLLCLQSDMVVA